MEGPECSREYGRELGIISEERVEMGRIRDELEKANLLEEICWRQKSRVLCVREGDMNTKFFHHIANSHRRVNSIDRLMVDGVLSSDLASIADCISQFYRQFYFEDVAHRPVLDDVDFFYYLSGRCKLTR